MFNPTKADQLPFLNEVLWSVLEIQNRHREKAIKHIYENIGQVLSYVRLKIGMLSLDAKSEDQHANELGTLIEKSIQDLRFVASLVHLDFRAIKNKQLFDAVVDETLLWNPGLHLDFIHVFGNPKKLPLGEQLMVCSLLQQVLLSICNNGNGQLFSIKLKYQETLLKIVIDCAGKSPEFDRQTDSVAQLLEIERPPLRDRLKMIGGKIKVMLTDENKFSVELIIPI